MKYSVRQILRNYREISTSDPSSDVFNAKLDIDRAIKETDLDEEEKVVLNLLYFSDPIEYPTRKVNTKGGWSGPPTGGTTQNLVGKLVIEEDKSDNARAIQISRTLKRTAEKLAEKLGDGYTS